MKPANDTNWINKLKIQVTSNSNKVFGNGRHQLEVSVSVTPKAGVEISEEQLNSIRLVTLDDGAYQELNADLQVSTERDKRFEYYAATGAAPAPLLEATSRRRRLYVSSTRPGGSLDVIYAAISKDKETEYVSNVSNFTSSVTVETLTPYTLGHSEMAWGRDDNYEHEIDDTDWDYDVYQLSFKNERFKMVDSIRYGAASGQVHYNKVIEVGSAESTLSKSYSHTVFAVSDETSLPVNTTTLRVRRHPRGSLLAVRTSTYGSTYVQAPTTPSQWGLIDQYGNEHKVELDASDDGNVITFHVIN